MTDDKNPAPVTQMLEGLEHERGIGAALSARCDRHNIPYFECVEAEDIEAILKAYLAGSGYSLTGGSARPSGAGCRMTHGPIEKKLVERMNLLALQLDDIFNPDEDQPKSTGFVLLAFPLNDTEGRMNYIANADRADIVVALKELVANFEGRVQETPRTKQ